MSQDVDFPQTRVGRSSRPRSRPAVPRDPQPTTEDLARLGIKVRDFIFESTLPPVRTIYRQPRQIQPSIPGQLHREDTEPIEESQSQSQVNGLARTLTEPVIEPEAGPSQRREVGGIFEFTNSGNDIIINHSQPSHINGDNSRFLASQNEMVPTPIVTPSGSLQWKIKEAEPSTSQHNMPLPTALSRTSNSMFSISSPLTPLTPSPPRQESLLLPSNRSPSMASLPSSPPKRRKIAKDNSGSRPVVKRYHLRKRTVPSGPSPTKRFHPTVHTSASPLSRSVSVRSDHSRKKNNEGGSTSSRPAYQRGSTSAGRGRRRHS